MKKGASEKPAPKKASGDEPVAKKGENAMTIKTLPERRGLVEGPFMYAQWWHNFCRDCDLEIGAYYVYHGVYPPKKDRCLKCAEALTRPAQPANLPA